MPRVERNADVTLVVLVYRSLRWLDWCMEGVDSSKNDTHYRWLVVANDPTEEVRADPRIGLVYENEDPSEFYINRVYRAWNAGVLEAPTQQVVMLNSDMYGSDHWLDALVVAKSEIGRGGKIVPTSLLVESGIVPSAMPEHVRDLGKNPEEFKKEDWLEHSSKIRQPTDFGKCFGKTEPGRLYMPILVDRQEFIDIGMYPEGNPPGTTGDKDLIRRYVEAGYHHVTALGSVVYHCQLGEQNWP